MASDELEDGEEDEGEEEVGEGPAEGEGGAGGHGCHAVCEILSLVEEVGAGPAELLQRIGGCRLRVQEDEG